MNGFQRFVARLFLLIEPVWNRNRHVDQLCTWCLWAFNRTSMESKHIWQPIKLDNRWTFNRTSMESKQNKTVWWVRKWNAFNRTSMESKHAIWERHLKSSVLLIEPVWNRNRSTSIVEVDPFSFNRTSMESKRSWTSMLCVRMCCF